VRGGKLRSLPAAARTRVCDSLLLFTPATVLHWHPERMRHKWTVHRRRTPGRPPIGAELADLIVRVAREKPRGAIAGLLGRWPNWALGWDPRRSLPYSNGTGCHQRPRETGGAPGAVGTSTTDSSSLPAICSRWKRSFPRRSSCCSSSRSVPGRCSWPGARGTRPPPWSRPGLQPPARRAGRHPPRLGASGRVRSGSSDIQGYRTE
jgi:hypothetical protein